MPELSIQGVRPTESSVTQNEVFSFNPLNTPRKRRDIDGLGSYNAADVYNNTAEPIEVRVNGDPTKFYIITESGGTVTILPEEDNVKIHTLIGINRGATSIDPNSTDTGCIAVFKRV